MLLPVALIAADIVFVAQRPIGQAFYMRAPDAIKARPEFEHTNGSAVTYLKPDWAPPVLLAMMANTGIIECYGVPESAPRGARAEDLPGYRGRAYVARGSGQAKVVEWSPNRALVKLEGVPEGSLVVYNMNWDPSWTANGQPAPEYEHTVAAIVEGNTTSVEFRYRPRTLGRSLGVLVLTLAVAFGGPLGWRRWRTRKA